MTSTVEALRGGFSDELEKLAFLDKLREKLFGPRVRENEPTPVLEDESKVKGALGRLGDFMRGFLGSKTWEKRLHGLLMFPGPHSEERQVAAINSVIDRMGEFPVNLDIIPGGSGGYYPDENLIEVVQGQLGNAYHEAGHLAGIEGTDPALRDAYIDLAHASSTWGPKAGLALLPNALLDPPGKRRALSKWGPVAAAVPSLPMLFEEGRANVLGGLAAKDRGDLGSYLGEQIPSYAGYLAQAGAVPLGLYLIHRAKERRLAEAQRAVQEDPELQKASHVAIGFDDEIEKLGGLKQLLAGAALGVGAMKIGPAAAKNALMGGAQRFDEGRPPRFGGGNITSQQGYFPLLEKIRFNPVVDAAATTLAPGAKALSRSVGTAADYYSGGFGGPKLLPTAGS